MTKATRAELLQGLSSVALTSTFGLNFSVHSATGDVISFAGELDFSIAPGVRQALARLPAPAVIDLSGVPYIDARIAGELVRHAQRIAPTRPALVGLRPQVRRILGALAADRLFNLSID